MCDILNNRPTVGSEGGGEQGILPQGPQTFKGPHENFVFMILSYLYGLHAVSLYLSLPQHCLDSVSERLGHIISNAFTVSVHKLFDACEHVESRTIN